MRKKLTCIIFLLVISLQLVIAAKTDSFEISAYKIGADDSDAEFFKLYVVDSMYDSFLGFDSTDSNNQIVINDKVNHLFDDLQTNPEPRTTTFNADTMIFHVIAMGNRTGEYSITLSFGPLKNEDGDSIDTAYTMGNARVNFENSEPSIIEGNTEKNTTYIYANDFTELPETWGRVKEKWNYTYKPITPSQNFTGVITDNGVLQLDWKILGVEEEYDDSWWRANPYKYSIYSSSTQSPLWIARAAVAMSIDKDSYDLSPEDEYRTSVTVTFTQN